MKAWSDACDLFFELSNEDRLNILFLVNEEAANITSIAKTLELSTQEVSRHVSRLEDQKIVTRDHLGNIVIDGFGKSVLFSLPYYQFISTHREYFNTHPIVNISPQFVSRLHELEESIIITDPMTVFQRIQLMCDEAEEFICRLTDKHLNIIYPHLQAAADRGVKFRLIEPSNYEPSLGSQVLPRVTPSMTRSLEYIPVFLAFSEKEVAAVSFPLSDGGYDYQSFSSKSPKAIKWCKGIFEYYWNRGSPTR